MALSFLPRDAGITRLFFFSLLFFTSLAIVAADTSIKLTIIRDSPSRRRIPKLDPRDDDLSCPSSAYNSCGSDVPSNFCCPSNQECLVLAAKTTILCCPKGLCQSIRPILCSIQLQDPALYPLAPILTTALDKELPRCGNACCPFGYTCKDETECVLNDKQDDLELFVPPASATSHTPEQTSITVAHAETQTPTGTLAVNVEPDLAPSEDDDSFNPAGLITAATVAGICLVAVVVMILYMKFGKKKAPERPPTRESFTKHRDSGWGSWTSFTTQEPLLPRQLIVKRGPDDKLFVTTSEPNLRAVAAADAARTPPPRIQSFALNLRSPILRPESSRPDSIKPVLRPESTRPDSMRPNSSRPDSQTLGQQSPMLNFRSSIPILHRTRTPAPKLPKIQTSIFNLRSIVPRLQSPTAFKLQSPTTEYYSATSQLQSPTTQLQSPADKIQSPKTQSPTTKTQSPTTKSQPPTDQLQSLTDQSKSPAAQLQSPTAQLQSPTPRQRPPSRRAFRSPIPSSWSPRPPTLCRRTITGSLYELPATPVSFCMWQDIENAEVQMPKLAYIIPAKRPAEKG